MVVRSVKWPRDTASVARSLSRADAWFWLDGTAVEPDGSAGLSYLGQAAEVVQSSLGHEREFLQRIHREHQTDLGGTGWVVALGYEFGVGLMGESPADDDVPPAFALRPSTVLVLDHSNLTAELRAGSNYAIDLWLEQHGESLEKQTSFEEPFSGLEEPGLLTDTSRTGPSTAGVPMLDADSPHSPAAESQSAPVPIWRRSDSQYLSDVRACKDSIHDGDAYVLCLTDTAEVTDLDIDPLSLYLEMLTGGAAVRGAIIVAGDRALVSASPERFLSKRGKNLATHPIKGTRARAEAPEADMILAKDLMADPKERSENLMIVDLMRNDLSRACVPGSVHTEGFLRLESHPRVHQLVSSVTGQIRDDADMINVLEACFPGGSMTGAPKRRAVQLLSALEGGPRGLYSGCFGWIGDDSDAELAMSIRCIELRGKPRAGQKAFVGAGGGVTSESDAAKELAEKQLKARPLLVALGCREPDPQMRTNGALSDD